MTPELSSALILLASTWTTSSTSRLLRRGGQVSREWFRSHPYDEGAIQRPHLRGHFDVLLDGEKEVGVVVSRE